MFISIAIFLSLAQAPTDVAFRIEAMVMQDQEARMRLVEAGKSGKPSAALVAEVQRIDREDTAAMKEIVDRNGWPTISAFGKKCSSNAWLLVQHADLDREFQQRCLDLMKPLVPKHEVSALNYAYLADRVSVAKTGKQVYGTQCRIKDGKVSLNPVVDPANLNKRRKEMGMMPIEDYLKLVRDMYLPKK